MYTKIRDVNVNMANCIRFKIQKDAFKKMIDLDLEKVMFVVKIIALNFEISAEIIIVVLVFEINGGNMYIIIILKNQDTTVLHWIVMLELEIWGLEIVIFLIVFCLVNIVTKKQYL